MQSKVYPNILFLQNQNLAFIGSQLSDPQTLEILPPSDAAVKRYSRVAQKLFSEIAIQQEMLWICRVPSTPIVRIYFSEPYHYPVAVCCRMPLFIELQQDLSGFFACSNCRKSVARFVFTEQSVGNDQELFLMKQRETKSRKQNLRELLTSQRFRGKKLRNNFMGQQAKSCQFGSFIMEITSLLPEKVDDRHEEKLTPRVAELRDIVNDIFS